MYTRDLRLGIPTLLKNPKLIMALRWVTTQINNVAKVHGSHFKKEAFLSHQLCCKDATSKGMPYLWFMKEILNHLSFNRHQNFHF
jgi:hypothetical protein